MIGFFKVKEFKSSILVEATSTMNSDVGGWFYLPPLNRQDTSGIATGSTFFGVLDDVTGYGALIVGIESADFNHSFGYSLEVTGDVKATSDVKIGTLSLKTHVHSVTVPSTPYQGFSGSPT